MINWGDSEDIEPTWACHLSEDWDGFSSYGDLNHDYDASPVNLCGTRTDYEIMRQTSYCIFTGKAGPIVQL